MRTLRQLAGLATLLAPLPALAHGFGRLYNLPVPFWLYAWAASAALLLSFLLAAYFATAPAATREGGNRDLGGQPLGRWLHRARPLLAALSLGLLLLCIATGLAGNRDPYRNFSMTFFWVVFVLGGTYLSALVGNVYAALNPWRVLTGLLSRAWSGYAQGRLSYREAWGDWPALALYLVFIGLELFGHSKPPSLAQMLLAYSALNLFGVWLVGAGAWFRHCELFSVFLRLIALMAPLDYRPAETAAGRGRLRLRRPFSGLLRERPNSLSTVAFALAMLSTTAFDGLRATQWWVWLFWRDTTGWLTALVGRPPISALELLRPWYIRWELFWLLISPFLYLAAYLACLWLAKQLTRSPRPLRELALDFGYSLLPIALVYHATHYSTLLLTQGLKIVSLCSDPFGWGWNLFGSAQLLRAPILPAMGTVWHTQVGLILFGHVLSVCVAHRIALRIWPGRRLALLSQLPMLLLMVAFTVAGLWILAQPLTVELMR
ncbi:MAG: hypothetical protein EPN60_07360 [Nevskiaceae bacterium]|nr:MAG: hypothetical protein EPN60_07360 [Nevskiaceae bacterium]